ncbi:hypothetical protein SPHINGO8BC_50608 [Sphingobacterium multivorum]|uniref:Uncharacterized protein n=1 Tax=Sphingobacterium multivorum TaxID=28454 RepID=A0A654C3A7_SPHMU|nr:hypothetical protein SPHINGO8BC_50608 [Sphingobacterium multivorum]
MELFEVVIPSCLKGRTVVEEPLFWNYEVDNLFLNVKKS